MSLDKLFEFIKTSPTAYNAVENLGKIFEKNGFSHIDEGKKWRLEYGGKYYVTRNRSSIIAFVLPEDVPQSFKITASHSDSPLFKLKDNFEKAENGYIKAYTEKYGGMILSTWTDRPLSVAGRLIIKDKNGVLTTKIVDLQQPMLVIPNMPPHLCRELNNGYSYNPQVDMIPISGIGGESRGIIEQAAIKAGCGVQDIVSYDLYVYCCAEPTYVGVMRDMFMAPRIDNLECAFASMQAITEAKCVGGINMCCVFDNEEVGSGTKQGADGTFLSDIIARIAENLGMTAEQTQIALASSLMLSADNAHALHPNHPEKYDGLNSPLPNGGVVIKYNANGKYTSDGVSAGIFREICKRAGVPTTVFANRADVAGGSTLGNISNSHVSINTVDIGLAQLAMHSAVETAGVRDCEYMQRAMTAFYESSIKSIGDGEYEVK